MIMQYHGIYSTDCRKQPFNNNKRYLFCELIFMLIRWVVEATTFKRMENCMKSAKQYNWFSQFLIQFYFVNSSEYFHIFWICIPDFSFRWVPFWQWNIASFFPALLILLIPFCEWIAFKINILLMMNWINEWMRREKGIKMFYFVLFVFSIKVFEDSSLRLQCVEWNVCLLHLKHAFSVKLLLSRSFFKYPLLVSTLHSYAHGCHMQVDAAEEIWTVQIKFTELLNFSLTIWNAQCTRVSYLHHTLLQENFSLCTHAQTFVCSQNPLRFCPVNTIYNQKSTTIKKFLWNKVKWMK